MSWVFAILALGTAAIATFSQDLKYSILCLWVSGLSIGAIFLTVDAEFLGVVQWIISTLVAISFIFFAVMFGDFGSDLKKKSNHNYLLIFCSLFVGVLFSSLVWVATNEKFGLSVPEKSEQIDLKVIGRAMVSTHYLSLEILTITLFLVLIGCGAIAKIEKGASK